MSMSMSASFSIRISAAREINGTESNHSITVRVPIEILLWDDWDELVQHSLHYTIHYSRYAVIRSEHWLPLSVFRSTIPTTLVTTVTRRSVGLQLGMSGRKFDHMPSVSEHNQLSCKHTLWAVNAPSNSLTTRSQGRTTTEVQIEVSRRHLWHLNAYYRGV